MDTSTPQPTGRFRPRAILSTLLVAIGLTLLPLDPHHRFGLPAVRADGGQATPAASSTPAPAPAQSRKPHAPPRKGEVRDMLIKDLGNFTYDPKDAPIPADVKALDGMSVRLKGFMIPTDETAGVTHFVLVPAVWSCCFGQPPEVQHVISVTCPKGMKVNFTVAEIYAEGKLEVKETKDDGYVVSLFNLSCTAIKPAGT